MFSFNKIYRSNYYVKKSYSQAGEDLIVDFIFSSIGINKPSYIDIGAHHPFYLSNTYHFYKKGARGVCIEPDPYLFKKIKKNRKNDICLNVGVGFNEDKFADFYKMSTPTLNTFSKVEAEKYQSYGNQKILEVTKLPLVSINNIIKTYFKEVPHFISLDVEGFDFHILKSLDLNCYRPKVLIIETLTYTENNSEKKVIDIADYLDANNYITFADTYINTIFVDRKTWENR